MRRKVSKLCLVVGIILIVLVCRQQHSINNMFTDLESKVTKETVNTKNNNGEKYINWKKLKKINNNICAWLYIPDTGVDYPVIKAKDNDYYLTHDIYNKSSQYGSIFFDARYFNKKISKVDNVIIYGHNMGHWNDTMFGKLMKFKDKNFYEKHKNIYLYTKKQKSVYKIVNVIRTTTKNIWYEFTDWKSYKYSVSEMREQLNNGALYSCRQLKNKSNTFITLSTCDYDGDFRIVVVGEKVK